jgi:4-amino-4-deoxy-L-arabinose transferase-like glycosyltransferase
MPLAAVAWRRLGPIALGELALLLATANGYGYHRDELYFRVAGRHLQWGYPDQPPLTPLLGRLSSAIFGDTPLGLRVAPALATAACVVLAGLIARELGGGAAAQTIASASLAVSGLLVAAHLLSTATFDIFFWALLSWLLVRLLRTEDPRLWLALGLVTGIALLNKHLILVFWASAAVGLAAGRRLSLVRSRHVLVGAALALALWAPNLVWQGRHGWPQLTLAHQIAGEDPTGNRIILVPFQLLLIGPLLAIVWIGGLVWLARNGHRALAWIYPALIVLTLAAAGKIYYPAGVYALLLGAGGVWLERRRVSPWLAGSVAVISLIPSALIGLPILPVADLHSTPIPDINNESQETVGWPGFARRVAAVYRTAPNAVIFTENYGEAGALDRFGPALGLPRAYSGHNGFADWGIPPDDRRTAVVVGFERGDLPSAFAGCRLEGRIDNGYGLDNEEQHGPIFVCRVTEPWSRAWPQLRHLDA